MTEPVLGQLTERQREILSAIKRAYADLLEPPAVRALARRFGVDHRAMQETIDALYRKGWLRAPTPAGVHCLHGGGPTPEGS